VALLASGASAQALDPAPSMNSGSIDREPITPLPADAPADPLKVALGERLFQEPRLSGDQMRSCASCHDTRTNGASGTRRDTAPNGQELPLNTITVFNAALSFRLNWAGGFRNLEEQAEASLMNPAIMGADLETVLRRLAGDRAMVERFRHAYGRGPDRGNLLDAIATYERSLLTPGSRFDRWLGGDDTALSAEEQAGYRLFKSVGCASCHQGVNVGGNLFQRHGIFHSLASPEPPVLRVPSLRNVSTTPPYFHDGSAATLEDAVRGMGLAQLNLKFSDQEAGTIVTFLRTLTGSYRGNPVIAPQR
jgi:cytochrome c peroxidase